MRLFVALLPPDAAAAEVALAAREARALPGADALRWNEPAGWHVTLAFYGETDAALLPALGERLAAVARAHAPFTLRLAGGGSFGDRALWAGVAGDTGALAALTALAAATDEAGRATGTPGGRHHDAYRPHLTLAGGGPGTSMVPFVTALTPFTGSPWPADRIVLLSSDEEHRYTARGTWPLTP
ncbi:RNA 2',3'-cyclic phosphodiesterase [Streptomyces sp. NBC_01803]|uniref:RNA 2',3'-cyclic phosphodiesterase n=1 Tax=Streptomyces sp. NBC_01803 TaxID=2975946 RepID=UPI002DDA984B|nr:RNA 2',3'-cyclic phosphodiesterase [Streptomyces sp. NBC_01803]WSA44761.1 RNA 2',3'-cyclic phosphodiesterase [Streptomyces sp. NBC_01803]